MISAIASQFPKPFCKVSTCVPSCSSGGSTVVVDEDTLRQAHRLARAHTGLRPSPTGTAGLAGVLQLQRQGVIGPGACVGVLFTGVERG